MTKYVAFLRGINVGGRIVKMEDLRHCFKKLGYGEVRTVAQTGNVLFESSKTTIQLKKDIEAAVTKRFKYPAKIQVWKLGDLQKIVEDYPFGEASEKMHDYVIFIENNFAKDILKENYELAAGEKVKAGKNVIYWRVDKGQTLRSSFSKTLTKAKYKDFNTNRNRKTLRKLLD